MNIIFNSISSTTLTAEDFARLEQIWRTRTPPPELSLSEQQYTSLAKAIALRLGADAESILDEEASRITNTNRLARFKFVRAALHVDHEVRASFFATLVDVQNRQQELWVLDAVGFLNHPLRAESALGEVRAGIELVEDIQRTGDILFPRKWMNAVLKGHRSVHAADTLQQFLDQHPDCPSRCVARYCKRVICCYEHRALRVADRRSRSLWPMRRARRRPAVRRPWRGILRNWVLRSASTHETQVELREYSLRDVMERGGCSTIGAQGRAIATQHF